MIYPESFEKKTGFDTVRSSITSLCFTEEGKRNSADMKFTADYGEVKRRLLITAEMLKVVTGDEDISIGKVRDIGRKLKSIKIPGTFLPAQDLADIRISLEAIDEIISFFNRRRDDTGKSSLPLLDAMAMELNGAPECRRQINSVIDQYGNVKDNASAELADIRKQISSLQSSLGTAMRRVIHKGIEAGYLESDTTPTVRDGRLVIPVQPMNKRKVNGIVHDESATGKTIFIEPAEIVETNNRIRKLEMDERREITRILIMTADILRSHMDELSDAVEILGEMDFIHAKGLYAKQTGGMMPHLSNKPEIEWYHATHPVLLATLKRQGKEIVPLDIKLSPEQRMLIISGPNAGGKSVCIKTVAITQYMIQSGILPTMYENSHVGIFRDLMIDIGDDQSIEDDLSTYSSHLSNMKTMLRQGCEKSLLILDEMGSGTEPQIGGALAQAMLKSFNEKGCWGVVTTHYQNLKTFAEETQGLVNGSMLYDRHLMKPLFKLSIGNAGSSFALEIARKTGLPEEIIRDAEEIVGSDYVNLDKYLLDIARDKRYWENKRLNIKQKEKKIENVLKQYEESANELREKRREIITDAKREAERILEQSNASIERTIHDIKKAQAEKEKTKELRKRFIAERNELTESSAINEHPLLKKAPKTNKQKSKEVPKPTATRQLTAGDTVKLEGQSTPGRIIEIDGDKATVAFGMLKTTVKLSRLTPTNAKIQVSSDQNRATSSNASRERQLSFKQEIDVRGMRVDEGVQAVTYFIDDAIQFNASRVRILHGTGTGALRQYIRQYLSTVPGVRNYHDEDVRFGGAGITVVELQ